MDISLLFPLLILLMLVPIFLSGRKQRRQMAEMQTMQAALEPGDVVMTTSGLRATVVDASYEETIDLEIADGVVTTWVRAAIRERVAPDSDPDDTMTEHAEDSESPPVVASASADEKPSLQKLPPQRASAESVARADDDSSNGSSTRN